MGYHNEFLPPVVPESDRGGDEREPGARCFKLASPGPAGQSCVSMTVDRLPLSVSIITFNEERNLGRCLESVRELASEIIIVDSGSTDRTAAIAREYGATFLHADWSGFVAQKAKSLEHCSQPWLLAESAHLVSRPVDLACLVPGMAAPPRTPGLRRVVRR
jgi:hypothetical protein